MKKQAENLTVEYDRLLEEHSKLLVHTHAIIIYNNDFLLFWPHISKSQQPSASHRLHSQQTAQTNQSQLFLCPSGPVRSHVSVNQPELVWTHAARCISSSQRCESEFMLQHCSGLFCYRAAHHDTDTRSDWVVALRLECLYWPQYEMKWRTWTHMCISVLSHVVHSVVSLFTLKLFYDKQDKQEKLLCSLTSTGGARI